MNSGHKSHAMPSAFDFGSDGETAMVLVPAERG